MESQATARWMVAAWCYFALVVIFGLLVGLVGERSWLGAVLLYVPRVVLLLPLILLGPPLWRASSRRRLWLPAAATLVVGGALMGPHLSWPGAARTSAPLRLLSYNVWYGRRGFDELTREIEAAQPHIVALQANSSAVDKFFRRYFRDWHVHSTGEFFLASRFPLRDVYVPETESGPPPAFARYTIDAPFGPIDLFNMHPYSPRPGLRELRGNGLRSMISSGAAETAIERIRGNTDARERQVRGVAEEAARSRHPVVIAGDTNLPGLSAIFRRYFSLYQDGFIEAGSGFGYTYPANQLPWMRIDRILAGRELRFIRFFVGGKKGSDHCPVIADLEKR